MGRAVCRQYTQLRVLVVLCASWCVVLSAVTSCCQLLVWVGGGSGHLASAALKHSCCPRPQLCRAATIMDGYFQAPCLGRAALCLLQMKLREVDDRGAEGHVLAGWRLVSSTEHTSDGGPVCTAWCCRVQQQQLRSTVGSCGHKMRVLLVEPCSHLPLLVVGLVQWLVAVNEAVAVRLSWQPHVCIAPACMSCYIGNGGLRCTTSLVPVLGSCCFFPQPAGWLRCWSVCFRCAGGGAPAQLGCVT